MSSLLGTELLCGLSPPKGEEYLDCLSYDQVGVVVE